MKVAVVGLWHLGCVTAACLATKHDVIAYDPDEKLIARLMQNQTPIFEPQLDDLLLQGRNAERLHYTNDVSKLVEAEIVWITFDTPVDDDDRADVAFVREHILSLIPHLQNNTLVLISSQLPVGSTRQLQQLCQTEWPEKQITFAYSPENLRLGKAISVFTKPDRVIMGIHSENDKTRLESLFAPFTSHLVWMTIESAEMTKHALNAFLATSVVFINEIATLCEQVGADAREVELGLKSEERIGPKAYLRPGGAIGGGTLIRDVNYLIAMTQQPSLFSALKESNEHHKKWICRKISSILKNLENKTITTLGLTYKAETNTLRRSETIETCLWLKEQGANIKAYDPVICELPTHLAAIIDLKTTLHDALHEADALIIATDSPQFSVLTAQDICATLKQPFVFDASGFLGKQLSQDKRIHYFSVGRAFGRS